MQHTALLQSLLALDLHNRSLIRNGRDEFVVDDYNRVVFDAALDDEVGNSSSISKCMDVTSNLVESQLEVVAQDTVELGFDLSSIMTMEEASGSTVESLAEAETRGVFGIVHGGAGGLGDGIMDTTTETVV